MANALLQGKYYEKAIVDTAPTSAGYSTTAVPESLARGFDEHRLTFSVSGGGGTVHLQYLGAGETTWQDEGAYTAGDAKLIDGTAHERQWKAICKNGNWSDTGDLIFGLEW